MTLTLEQSKNSAFVARITGAARSVSYKFRLDGSNGYHKFLWLNRGNGCCMIDGETRGFGPHTLIYIPDNTPHHIDIGINTHGFAIAINKDSSVHLPNRPILLCVSGLIEQTKFSAQFDVILREYHSDNDDRQLAIENHISLLSLSSERLYRKASKGIKIAAAQRLMKAFAQLIETSFRSARSLTDYASELGVTPTHLNRVCQKLNNKTSSHFIQDRILVEARCLLLRNNNKIQEISNKLGFNSPAYFSRIFAARLGTSPKEFRKLYASNNGKIINTSPMEMAS